MLMIILALIGLLILFYCLGLLADFVVKNSSDVANEFGLPLPLIGLILGLITTLPELSLGLNALKNNVPAMSAGNLLGGIFIILSLVLAVNLFINREVKTDGRWTSLLPLFFYLLLPLILGFDGYFGYFDSLLLILGYFLWLVFSYFGQSHGFKFDLVAVSKKKLARQFVFIIVGALGILIASGWIVNLTLFVLETFDIKPFLIGILLFAIGTNLPELSIAWGSKKHSAGALSFSHLSGSAGANVLCLGLLGLSGSLALNAGSGPAFYVYSGLLILLLLFLLWFYHSDKKLSRFEGIVLLVFYILFALSQFFLVA